MDARHQLTEKAAAIEFKISQSPMVSPRVHNDDSSVAESSQAGPTEVVSAHSAPTHGSDLAVGPEESRERAKSFKGGIGAMR